MTTNIHPGSLSGKIDSIPAKAYAHRILICAALSERETVVKNLFDSEDILATTNCLTALGAEISGENGVKAVKPIKNIAKSPVLDCSESGSTLRFLLPVCGAIGANAKFIGRGKLPERPLTELIAILRSHGVECSDEKIPLEIRGKMSGESFAVDGSLSSQYVTGMLFALSAMGNVRRLEVVGKRASGSYIRITEEILREFGMKIVETDREITLSGRLTSPGEISVEGDWSNAAFWLVAGAIGENPIEIKNLRYPACQGDSVVAEFLNRMGGSVERTADGIISRPSKLKGAEFDCSDCPDLVPIMTIAAACAEGESKFYNVDRLKIKECDRLFAMEEMLRKCGIIAHDESNVLTVKGGKPHNAKVRGFADHRIIMSAAILGTKCGITIDDCAGVKKSYPGFFRDFEKLGGSYDLTV